MASRHRYDGYKATDNVSYVEMRDNLFCVSEQKYDPKLGKRRKYRPHIQFRNMPQNRAMPMVIGLLTARWDWSMRGATPEDIAKFKSGNWQIHVHAEDIARQLRIRTNIVKEIFHILNLRGILSQAQHKQSYGGLRSEQSCWISDFYLIFKKPSEKQF